MASEPEILLADADVLIDYAHSDPSILQLVSRHIGPLRVLREVLQEVKELNIRRCRELAIAVVRPPTALLLRASNVTPALSFSDRLCVIACEEYGWTCLSNDGAVGKACKQRNVAWRRGLGLMVDLVRTGALGRQRAFRIGTTIHEPNPRHINEQVLRTFRGKLVSARPGTASTVPTADVMTDALAVSDMEG